MISTEKYGHGTGTSISGQEKSVQQSLLQRVLESSAADVPPHLIVEAALVLSSSSFHGARKRDSTPSSWLQEGEDGSTLRQQLDALARGQQFLSVHFAACRHTWTHSSWSLHIAANSALVL